MDITFFDATGKITGAAQFRDDLADMIRSGNDTQPHIEGDHFADRDTKYVVDGVLTDRPTQSTTLTGFTLSGLPVPCKIRINAATYDCADDHADLSFGQPGTYKVTVLAWPYQDKEFTIENPA